MNPEHVRPGMVVTLHWKGIDYNALVRAVYTSPVKTPLLDLIIVKFIPPSSIVEFSMIGLGDGKNASRMGWEPLKGDPNDYGGCRVCGKVLKETDTLDLCEDCRKRRVEVGG